LSYDSLLGSKLWLFVCTSECMMCCAGYQIHEAANVLQDFSDLVAQKAAQQKRKAAQAKESGKAKKQKSDNFKF